MRRRGGLLGGQRRHRPADVPGGLVPLADRAQTDRGRRPERGRRHGVGALNPNGTDALFSNAGPWVRGRAFGASVMSTLPPFQGGLQPMARVEHGGEVRESIDPDDYTGGFALWSGTSFAAPLFAGHVAAAVGSIDPAHDRPMPSPAVGARWLP